MSRLFGPSEPEPSPIDQDLAAKAEHAQELIQLANDSLAAACRSLDPVEREEHQQLARMAVVRLEHMALMDPRISLTSLAEFEEDLRLVTEATKDLRRERLRKERNIPDRY